MSHQEPTAQETAVHDATVADPALATPREPVYQPYEEGEEWPEEPTELPPRPRRRLLGTDANPIALGLLAILLLACGFIGGVLVEKGETSSGSSAGSTASLASRFAALRGGTSASGAHSSTGAAAGAGGSGFAGAFAGASGSGTRPTAGTVAYLAGSTLYVTSSEGNTVKVTTSPATSVSKTVKAKVTGIHPGETVTVTGTSGSSGAVSAESISVGSSASGLAALFGGGKASSGASSGSGGEAALFGNGG
jgi:hypothetical protein